MPSIFFCLQLKAINLSLTLRSKWGRQREANEALRARWHSVFTRMKSFNKDSLLCCSQSGSVVPGRCGICYLISELPAEWDGGEVMACSMLLCSTESFPDGCDLWTSHNTGTNERLSSCVSDGAVVFGHRSGLWGVSGECWKVGPDGWGCNMNKVNMNTTNYSCSQQNVPVRLNLHITVPLWPDTA